MGGKSLTQGTPWKGILSFMFPIFAGLLLQQLYNTVDTIVVGNFAGEEKEMRAQAFSALLLMLGMGAIATVVGIFISLFQGANDALYSTFVATAALAIRVVSTYVLKEIPAISYHMIWWNTLFGWALGVL